MKFPKMVKKRKLKIPKVDPTTYASSTKKAVKHKPKKYKV